MSSAGFAAALCTECITEGVEWVMVDGDTESYVGEFGVLGDHGTITAPTHDTADKVTTAPKIRRLNRHIRINRRILNIWILAGLNKGCVHIT